MPPNQMVSRREMEMQPFRMPRSAANSQRREWCAAIRLSPGCVIFARSARMKTYKAVISSHRRRNSSLLRSARHEERQQRARRISISSSAHSVLVSDACALLRAAVRNDAGAESDPRTAASRGGGDGNSAHGGAHFGQQHIQREGLGQVIVRAGIQAAGRYRSSNRARKQ